MLNAIKSSMNYKIFNYANDELKTNKVFVLQAIKLDHKILKLVSDELKADRNFVLAAVIIMVWLLNLLQKT